jgi:protein-S-isoprenylcysteine O-methyltransferase Ste14
MASLIGLVAILVGGGSMFLFGVFLFFGPLPLVRMGWSEPGTLAWDGLLSLAFFGQHSSMLRRGIRRQLARVIPAHYHGALYAIASGVVLTAVVVLWQPASTLLYAFEGISRWLVRGLFLLAMAGMAWGAQALGTFDPLGLAPLRARERGGQLSPPELVIQGAYQWVRHPLYLFSILMIWCNPDVTVDRLLFDVLWTAWIYGATFLEEADLVGEFGEAYRDYQRKVPRLIPWRSG